MTDAEREALDDIRGTFKESLHYLLERVLLRLDALERASLPPQPIHHEVSDLDSGPSREE